MTKQPPVTLRVPAEVRAEVEAYATRRGVPKNAAYVELIERGLKATGEAKALASVAKKDAASPRTAAPAVQVTAPVFQRKAFNPQPKKGKTK